MLSDAEKRKKELERYEQALCPYSPDLLIFAKSNIQMVTSVERKLNEFLNNSTNATKYFDFPPMKLLFRSVIIAICVRIRLNIFDTHTHTHTHMTLEHTDTLGSRNGKPRSRTETKYSSVQDISIEYPNCFCGSCTEI